MPREISSELRSRLLAIEFLVLDVDGVLTDGGIVYDEAGGEQKRFHVRDGSGLLMWRHSGKKAGILTGRTSRIVERRAAELGLSPVMQGAAFKLPAYRRMLEATGFRPEQTAVIADDVPDLGLMMNAGLAVAVADAAMEVRTVAHYVTAAIGGQGAVREMIELILKAQGRWDAIVDRFQNERL